MKPIMLDASITIPGSGGGFLGKIFGNFGGIVLIIIGICLVWYAGKQGMSAMKGGISWSEFFKHIIFFIGAGAIVVFAVSYFTNPDSNTNSNIKNSITKGTDSATNDLNSVLGN